MSDKSRVTIQVSETRSIIIYGTRNGRALAATKAVCTDYRGYVLLLGQNGKVYSPHVSGIHWADIQKASDRQMLLLKGLQQLGVVTAEEVDAAAAKGRMHDERRTRKQLAYQLRESAQQLGIKIPAAMEKRLNAAC
ncbi:MAG: hypothetical protein CL858_24355 [Cupriavidus sp.]|nr:hypothetical protein [Cupriavidus sp.]